MLRDVAVGPVSPIEALRAEVESVAQDTDLPHALRLSELRRLRQEAEVVLGALDTYIAGAERFVVAEREVAPAVVEHVAQTVPLLREEILGRGEATPEELDEAGYFDADEIERLREEGLLEAWAAEFDERKHWRDRRGRFRDMPDRLVSTAVLGKLKHAVGSLRKVMYRSDGSTHVADVRVLEVRGTRVRWRDIDTDEARWVPVDSVLDVMGFGGGPDPSDPPPGVSVEPRRADPSAVRRQVRRLKKYVGDVRVHIVEPDTAELEPDPFEPDLKVRRTRGESVVGTLRHVDAQGLRVDVSGEHREFYWDDVVAVDLVRGREASGEPAPGATDPLPEQRWDPQKYLYPLHPPPPQDRLFDYRSEVAAIESWRDAERVLEGHGIEATLRPLPGSPLERDGEFFRQITEAVLVAKDKFPALTDGPVPLKRVSLASNQSLEPAFLRDENSRRGVWAIAAVDTDRSVELLNGLFYGRQPEYAGVVINDYGRDITARRIRATQMGGLGPTADSPFGRMLHEMGHVVYTASGIGQEFYADLDEGAVPFSMKALEKAGLGPGFFDAWTTYGANAPNEAWAEAFAALNFPEGAHDEFRPLAEDVWEGLEDLRREANRREWRLM